MNKKHTRDLIKAKVKRKETKNKQKIVATDKKDEEKFLELAVSQNFGLQCNDKRMIHF